MDFPNLFESDPDSLVNEINSLGNFTTSNTATGVPSSSSSSAITVAATTTTSITNLYSSQNNNCNYNVQQQYYTSNNNNKMNPNYNIQQQQGYNNNNNNQYPSQWTNTDYYRQQSTTQATTSVPTTIPQNTVPYSSTSNMYSNYNQQQQQQYMQQNKIIQPAQQQQQPQLYNQYGTVNTSQYQNKMIPPQVQSTQQQQTQFSQVKTQNQYQIGGNYMNTNDMTRLPVPVQQPPPQPIISGQYNTPPPPSSSTLVNKPQIQATNYIQQQTVPTQQYNLDNKQHSFQQQQQHQYYNTQQQQQYPPPTQQQQQQIYPNTLQQQQRLNVMHQPSPNKIINQQSTYQPQVAQLSPNRQQPTQYYYPPTQQQYVNNNYQSTTSNVYSNTTNSIQMLTNTTKTFTDTLLNVVDNTTTTATTTTSSSPTTTQTTSKTQTTPKKTKTSKIKGQKKVKKNEKINEEPQQCPSNIDINYQTQYNNSQQNRTTIYQQQQQNPGGYYPYNNDPTTQTNNNVYNNNNSTTTTNDLNDLNYPNKYQSQQSHLQHQSYPTSGQIKSPIISPHHLIPPQPPPPIQTTINPQMNIQLSQQQQQQQYMYQTNNYPNQSIITSLKYPNDELTAVATTTTPSINTNQQMTIYQQPQSYTQPLLPSYVQPPQQQQQQQMKTTPYYESLSSSSTTANTTNDSNVNKDDKIISKENEFQSIIYNENKSQTINFSNEPKIETTNTTVTSVIVDNKTKKNKKLKNDESINGGDSSSSSLNDSIEQTSSAQKQEVKLRNIKKKEANDSVSETIAQIAERGMSVEDEDSDVGVNKSKDNKKTLKKRNSKQNLIESAGDTGSEQIDSSFNDGDNKKKRRYNKKKLISNIISKEMTSVDIIEISNVEASISSIFATVASNDESSSNQLHASKVNDDFITTPNASKKGRKKGSLNKEPSKQRKKSAQHLVKLLKKKQRKKRKLSSDEEEEDDSADDFELTSSAAAAINAAVMKSSSTASVCEQIEGPIDTNTSSQAASIMTDPNANVDEQTAKLLQANEKRRSVRAAASKRQKYVDDIDFKLTEDKADESGGDEQNQQVASGNPAFAIITNDALVVDKILGNRTIKRKIKIQKKIEKDKKTKCDIANNEAKATTKMEIEEQETIVVEIVDTENKTEKVSEEENKTLEEEKKQEEIEESESEYEEVDGDEEEEVEEFFVKYKALSYLHCEWHTRDELVLQDKRIDQKIKRFKLKKAQANIYNDSVDGYEEELFNPDYVEVDRILDFYETADLNNELIKYYLVKWKTLAYEESTWELEKDISKAKIERYFKFNTIPTDTRIIPRPKADKWNCQTQSRIYKNGNGLREYQLEGINWLTFCWLNGRNCILADEMGLGKTIQSITFLQEIAYYGIRGPFLVIVPLSTIGNWSREFETWTDFNIIVYHGSSQSRALIQDYEFYYKDDTKKLNKNFPKFNALITTYEVLLSDVTMFCQFKWRSLIIDEAHRLKNKNCKLIEGLRCMDVEHKVLLTGTPLQNNVEELFSLLNYLEPTQFHSSYEFMQEFGDLKTDTQVTKLQAILKPMMLRRLKEDVEKNLAPKEETIIEVELTNIQKKYYRAILEKNFQFLARGTAASNMPNLMNTMMELRKCCNHPYLINGAEDQILYEYNERNIPNSSDDQALKIMVQASGKLVLVDKLLPKLKAGGHKVLIFSQMIRVLDILEDYLVQMRLTYERLDGRIRGEMRQEAIDRFCKPDSDRFAFLLCTRAGGLGINLTAADTVIIYDSDWNPQNDLQAQARCHRIGQSKSVKIYRLITRNTYEREMFDRASLKLGLDKAILQSMRNEERMINQSNQLGKKEIEDLLKKGAYGAIMEEDNAGDNFCEEDIDKILQQRATVIQIEGGEKGSTFSKASFSTSETRSDISIDDPEFWQKWAKKADIDIESTKPKDDRIIYEPRRRTQTRRYGGPDDVLEEGGSDYSTSDSDDDKNGKKNKKGKRGDAANGCSTSHSNGIAENAWGRDECYKVEKCLLIYGWNQWTKIVTNCKFNNKKRQFTEKDVESLSRTILLFSLQNYHGDENIKQFILDLIDPAKSKDQNCSIDFKNHYGLAAPVPRGRKGKKNDTDCDTGILSSTSLSNVEWARNPDELLADDNYKKHLIRQANRILLRVRMLFYIKQEIIGEYASMIEDGYNANDIDFHVPTIQADLPTSWWDKEADRSLLIGVYKYGYEKYNQMRADPCLCFLNLCGPPNAKDLLEEQRREEEGGDMEEDDGDYKPANERRLFKSQIDQMNDDDMMMMMDIDEQNEVYNNNNNKKFTYKQQNSTSDDYSSNSDKYSFPSVSELNIRLRRVITSFQKLHKKEILMSKRNAEKQEKRLSKLASTQEKAVQRQIEKQTKWSRREESNFYRALSTFGVDFDKTTNSYRWDHFREIGQLDKKLDETLGDYFNAFYYMCKKVCNKIDENDQLPAVDFMVETISEERANRCIQRVELLNKLRQEIVNNSNLEERIKLCKTSVDLPDWWIPIKHDKELIIAATRYGITRTDYYYLNDPEFTFKEYLTKYMKHIEILMGDNKIDPIQYYFLNQAKIQQSFKEILDKEMAKELGIESVVENEKKEEQVEISINSDNSKLQIDETKSFIDDENYIESKKVIESIINNIINEIENEDQDVKVVKEEFKEETDIKPSLRQQQQLNDIVLNMQNQYAEGNDSKPPLGVPMIMWPKDRIICHRLENIIHCVENNEWPERNPFLLTTDQQGLMHSSSMIMSNYNDKLPASPMLSTSDINDYFDNNSNDKDFKIGFDYDIQQQKGSSKYQKPKRGRPPKVDDPANKIRHLLTQLPPGADENDFSEIMNAAKSSLFGGSSPSHIPTSSSSHSSVTAPFLEPGEIVRKNAKDALLNSLSNNNNNNNSNNKRCRKPTKDPMSMLFLGPNFDPEERVPVINVEDGTRLSGDDAPKRIDLADFLSQNKNFLPEQSDIFELAFGNRRSAKTVKQNHPSTPHDALNFLQNLSQNSSNNNNNNIKVSSNNRQSSIVNNDNGQQNEPNIFNVCFINKTTNKKFVPTKPPTWKNLANFFEKNVDIYIDPVSTELVRSKYGRNIPEIIKSRILPSKINKTSLSSSTTTTHQQNNKDKQLQNNGGSSLLSNNNKQNINQNKDKKQICKNPTSSSSNSSLSSTSQQQSQITYPPLSPNSAASLAGLSELLMQQGGFNPLTASLPGFMAAAAAQGSGGPMGLPFGGLGFNPFLMPPFGSSPFGSSPLEDFMKQLGAQKPVELNLESATNGILSAIQSSVKEPDNKDSRSGDTKTTNKREKEQRGEKINLQESLLSSKTINNNDKEIKDRTRKESERDKTLSNKEKERRDLDRHEKDKNERNSTKDNLRESKGGHHHNTNNTSSSSKRLNNNDSSSSRKEHLTSKEKSSTNQQQQNLNNHEKFMQEIMNLSQLAATNSFNPNFYLNPLGFSSPQLDSTSSSPTPDAATTAALSQLGGPSSLDFSLLLNMMNPLFGSSMPPPSSSSSGAAANSVDLLSALSAAAQTNPNLLDPNQLNKNLLMDFMLQQQQQQQSDEIINQTSTSTSNKTSSHKKHSIDSISRSSSNNKPHSSKSSESPSSHHHHYHSSSSKQQSNKQNQQQQPSSSIKNNSIETFQGLDLSIKKPKNKNENENENLLKSPTK